MNKWIGVSLFLLAITPRLLILCGITFTSPEGSYGVIQEDGYRYYWYARAISSDFSVVLKKGGVSLERLDEMLKQSAPEKPIPDRLHLETRDNDIFSVEWRDVPLYYFVLALIFSILKNGVFLASIANILLFGISACLLFKILKEIFNIKVAILSACIYAVYPITVFYSIGLFTEPLAMTLLLGALFYYVKYLKSEKLNYFLFSVLFSILAALTKEVLIVLIPCMFLLLDVIYKKTVSKRILIYCLLIFLGLTPWLLRNQYVAEKWTLSEKISRYSRFINSKIENTVQIISSSEKESQSSLKHYLKHYEHYYLGVGIISLMKAYGYDHDQWRPEKAKYLINNYWRTLYERGGPVWTLVGAVFLLARLFVYIFALLGLIKLIRLSKWNYLIIFLAPIIFLHFTWSFHANARYFFILIPCFSTLAAIYFVRSEPKETLFVSA